jgi:hypothetical protein
MYNTEYAIQARKRHQIQLDLKEIASLRKMACESDPFNDTTHAIMSIILKNSDIFLIDPNNLVVNKENIGICMDYERFFYYDTRIRADSWDGVHILQIVQDPFNLTTFIPKQLPLYGKGNLIEDYAKIDSYWLEKNNDVIYVRYSQINPINHQYGFQVKLLNYPTDPRDFQHFVMNEVNQDRANLCSTERNDSPQNRFKGLIL